MILVCIHVLLCTCTIVLLTLSYLHQTTDAYWEIMGDPHRPFTERIRIQYISLTVLNLIT